MIKAGFRTHNNHAVHTPLNNTKLQNLIVDTLRPIVQMEIVATFR